MIYTVELRSPEYIEGQVSGNKVDHYTISEALKFAGLVTFAMNKGETVVIIKKRLAKDGQVKEKKVFSYTEYEG